MSAPFPVSQGVRTVNVTVRLRSEGRKLLASAVFHTADGDFLIDFIYVRHNPGYDRPRAELPGRPDGSVFRQVIRIPDPWYVALVDAIAAALEP